MPEIKEEDIKSGPGANTLRRAREGLTQLNTIADKLKNTSNNLRQSTIVEPLSSPKSVSQSSLNGRATNVNPLIAEMDEMLKELNKQSNVSEKVNARDNDEELNNAFLRANPKIPEQTTAAITASLKVQQTFAGESVPANPQPNQLRQVLDASYFKSTERKQVIAELWRDHDAINAFNAAQRPNGQKLSAEMQEYIAKKGGIGKLVETYKADYNKSLSRDAEAFKALHTVDPNKNNSLTWQNDVGRLQNGNGAEVKWNFGSDPRNQQQSDVMLSFKDTRGNPAGPDKGLSSLISFDKNGKISDMHISGPLYGHDGTYVSSTQLKNMQPADVAAAFGNGELYALRPGADGKMQKYNAPFNANQLKAMYAEHGGRENERQEALAFLKNPSVEPVKTQTKEQGQTQTEIPTTHTPNQSTQSTSIKISADGKIDIANGSGPVRLETTKDGNTINHGNITHAPSQTLKQGLEPIVVNINLNTNTVTVNGGEKQKLVAGKANYITVSADGKLSVSTNPPANSQFAAQNKAGVVTSKASQSTKSSSLSSTKTYSNLRDQYENKATPIGSKVPMKTPVVLPKGKMVSGNWSRPKPQGMSI